MHYLLRGSVVLVLCLTLVFPSFSQGGFGQIGPSKGEIAGVLVAAGVVIGGLIYLAYHETHKHPTITGCVSSVPDGMTLTAQKDKKVYVLSGELSAVKDGEEVAVKGKKSKGSAGKLLFQVEKVSKDLGVCRP